MQSRDEGEGEGMLTFNMRGEVGKQVVKVYVMVTKTTTKNTSSVTHVANRSHWAGGHWEAVTYIHEDPPLLALGHFHG